MKPRRYQLRKEAVAIIERGHPWIFRDQLSSAAQVFTDGDWLRLVDGANRIVGYGLFEAAGAIAIRVLRLGAEPPDAAWLRGKLQLALARRGLGPLRTAGPLIGLPPATVAQLVDGDLEAVPEQDAPSLAARTDGMRLVHGESDGIPAVVIDRYGDTLVVQCHARGARALARLSASMLSRELAIPHVAWQRAPRTSKGRSTGEGTAGPRALCGAPPTIARFTEDGVTFSVDLSTEARADEILDLRGLRRAIAAAPLAGARVLDLFAATGTLGRIAELAGAAAIVQVDASEAALAFAAAHHVADPAKHSLVTADVFQWLPALPADEAFDLVIVHPPEMTSRMGKVPAVLSGYRKLYRAAAPHVRPGGVLVAACRTSRIEPGVFHKTVADSLGGSFARERVITPEPDHPVGFKQANYLKIGWWRRRPAG